MPLTIHLLFKSNLSQSISFPTSCPSANPRNPLFFYFQTPSTKYLDHPLILLILILIIVFIIKLGFLFFPTRNKFMPKTTLFSVWTLPSTIHSPIIIHIDIHLIRLFRSSRFFSLLPFSINSHQPPWRWCLHPSCDVVLQSNQQQKLV